MEENYQLTPESFLLRSLTGLNNVGNCFAPSLDNKLCTSQLVQLSSLYHYDSYGLYIIIPKNFISQVLTFKLAPSIMEYRTENGTLLFRYGEDIAATEFLAGVMNFTSVYAAPNDGTVQIC